MSLAFIPTLQEHRARLQELKIDEPPLAQIVELQEFSEPDYMSEPTLSPNLEVFAAMKERTSSKPTFDKKSKNYEDLIQTAAREHEVSPALVKAVIQAESNFNSQAVSSQGAVGLMQILPSTARSVGVRSLDSPKDNITAGVRYLKVLLDEFGDEEYLAIAAYNCGPDLVKRYGNNLPPINQTRVFVSQVMEYYQSHITES
ncbi:MAG: lytic transglycosylase domain-containing protein [Deltaproteobacteria bacterium]|nr:lytic transglycosylase domain-containing protein [Deltaproteobacteria bacterium]